MSITSGAVKELHLKPLDGGIVELKAIFNDGTVIDQMWQFPMLQTRSGVSSVYARLEDAISHLQMDDVIAVFNAMGIKQVSGAQLQPDTPIALESLAGAVKRLFGYSETESRAVSVGEGEGHLSRTRIVSGLRNSILNPDWWSTIETSPGGKISDTNLISFLISPKMTKGRHATFDDSQLAVGKMMELHTSIITNIPKMTKQIQGIGTKLKTELAAALKKEDVNLIVAAITKAYQAKNTLDCPAKVLMKTPQLVLNSHYSATRSEVINIREGEGLPQTASTIAMLTKDQCITIANQIIHMLDLGSQYEGVFLAGAKFPATDPELIDALNNAAKYVKFDPSATLKMLSKENFTALCLPKLDAMILFHIPGALIEWINVSLVDKKL